MYIIVELSSSAKHIDALHRPNVTLSQALIFSMTTYPQSKFILLTRDQSETSGCKSLRHFNYLLIAFTYCNSSTVRSSANRDVALWVICIDSPLRCALSNIQRYNSTERQVAWRWKTLSRHCRSQYQFFGRRQVPMATTRRTGTTRDKWPSSGPHGSSALSDGSRMTRTFCHPQTFKRFASYWVFKMLMALQTLSDRRPEASASGQKNTTSLY